MRNKQNPPTVMAAALRGFAAFAAILAIVLGAAALLISLGKIPESFMNSIVIFATAISACGGGFTAALTMGRRRLAVGASFGGATALLYLLIAAIASRSSFPEVWNAIVSAVLIVGGSLGGYFAAMHKSRAHGKPSRARKSNR